MTTTGKRGAMSAHTSRTPATVAPEASAAVPAAATTGPSASGSENGMPSSTRSAPPSAYACPIAREVSRSGKPPIRYGISAARPDAPAKAAAIRCAPATGARSAVSTREHLGEVLVPAARAAHEVDRGVPRAHRVVQGVRGLQRRDDALQPRHAAEGGQRVVVAHGDVGRAAAVAQPGVLRAGAGVVEAGGDRVRLGDLALVVLHDRAERAVQHAGTAARGERRAV